MRALSSARSSSPGASGTLAQARAVQATPAIWCSNSTIRFAGAFMDDAAQHYALSPRDSTAGLGVCPESRWRGRQCRVESGAHAQCILPRERRYSGSCHPRGVREMTWETPTFVEVKMDAEINSYQDDFGDDRDTGV